MQGQPGEADQLPPSVRGGGGTGGLGWLLLHYDQPLHSMTVICDTQADSQQPIRSLDCLVSANQTQKNVFWNDPETSFSH